MKRMRGALSPRRSAEVTPPHTHPSSPLPLPSRTTTQPNSGRQGGVPSRHFSLCEHLLCGAGAALTTAAAKKHDHDCGEWVVGEGVEMHRRFGPVRGSWFGKVELG
jgi:hypothetical protein